MTAQRGGTNDRSFATYTDRASGFKIPWGAGAHSQTDEVRVIATVATGEAPSFAARQRKHQPPALSAAVKSCLFSSLMCYLIP